MLEFVHQQSGGHTNDVRRNPYERLDVEVEELGTTPGLFQETTRKIEDDGTEESVSPPLKKSFLPHDRFQ